jgi:Helicase associated domain
VTPDQAWAEGYRRLLDFVAAQGHTRVPYAFAVDGHHVGRWVSRQRTGHAKGTLDADRRRRLEAVSGWVWDIRDVSWGMGLNELRRYVRLHGDARVPHSTIVGDFRLGTWVGTQRTHHAKGRLDPARRAELERLPGWVWKARADLWERNFSHLADYLRRHGSACVPVSYADERGKLGTWVHNQRCQHGRGQLDTNRVRRLQALPGWTWNCLTDTG